MSAQGSPAFGLKAPLVITPETVQAGPVDPLVITYVRSVPQSEMTSSSPASSPCLCTLWTKTRQRHQAGAPDTLAGRQLLSPTCQTAVAALFNGAGEREVKKLNLLRSPVFWCLGDGPTMHEPGALPKTPGRRVTALPMTGVCGRRNGGGCCGMIVRAAWSFFFFEQSRSTQPWSHLKAPA